MSEQLARIERLDIAPGRRILVVSDIHANVDFLEKGTESLRTLRILMALTRRGNTHLLLGNCDDWASLFDSDWDDARDEHVLSYMLWRKSGLLWDMCNEAGISPFEMEDFAAVKAQLHARFPEEWAFLSSLPHAIETERFVFAHAGMHPDKPLYQHLPQELYKVDSFLTRGWSFDRWVIVGHWPVMLYGTDTVCANPIVDREKKIVSIDGGCVLKDDGQLNCLIIPHRDSEDFQFVAYDPFPERTVTRDQKESERSYYIRWGDSTVQVLRRGVEFSRCRHLRTGYEMDILTKYLFTDNEVTDCNDCTDYVLPLKAGDRVRVVEETSLGYFVKHNGVSGWYYGELR